MNRADRLPRAMTAQPSPKMARYDEALDAFATLLDEHARQEPT